MTRRRRIMTGILEGDGDEQVRIPSTIVTREVAEDAKTFLREHSGIDFDAFHAGATVESLLGEAQESTSQIGDIEPEGPHKGEVYGGIFPGDNKPIWFSAAHKLMNHYNAAAWATEQGGALPTREQGDYLMTLKGKGGAFSIAATHLPADSTDSSGWRNPASAEGLASAR
jgi:hypothetical protein